MHFFTVCLRQYVVLRLPQQLHLRVGVHSAPKDSLVHAPGSAQHSSPVHHLLVLLLDGLKTLLNNRGFWVINTGVSVETVWMLNKTGLWVASTGVSVETVWMLNNRVRGFWAASTGEHCGTVWKHCWGTEVSGLPIPQAVYNNNNVHLLCAHQCPECSHDKY